MRFVITNQWSENHLLRVVMLWFLLFVLLFWITNMLLFVAHYGTSYSSVVEAYLGSDERFLSPRSYRGLLEVTHAHLFAMGVLILTMTHLLLFVPLSPQLKALVVSLAFASTLGDELSGWLIRFVHPAFGYLKIAAFLTLQATLGFLVVAVSWSVLADKPMNNGNRHGCGAKRQSED